MRLRFAPRALREAKRLKAWWLANRPKAPGLFETELAAALERIATGPHLGTLYEHVDTNPLAPAPLPPRPLPPPLCPRPSGSPNRHGRHAFDEYLVPSIQSATPNPAARQVTPW